MDGLTKAWGRLSDKINEFWDKCGTIERFLIGFGGIAYVLIFLHYSVYRVASESNGDNWQFALSFVAIPALFLFDAWLLLVAFNFLHWLVNQPPNAAHQDQSIDQALWDVIIAKNLPVPPPEVFELIVRVANSILDDENFEPLPFPADASNDQAARRKRETTARDARLALISALQRYLSYLPKFEPSAFTQPLAQMVDIGRLSYDLIQPLRPFKEQGFFRTIVDDFNQAVVRVTKEKNARELVYPQAYEPKRDIPEVYFKNSPFAPLLALQVPLPLYDKTRFEHHHVLGRRGNGKSTFLSHMINHDIRQVPDVSVMVIDSQHRLIDSFARLPNVEPILIGPSAPIPLNPFKLGTTSDVVEILTYAFGSLFEADMTALQTGPTQYIIQAVAQDPNANLDTLVDFILSPKSHLIEQADQNTQTYFRHFYKDLPKNTRSGIVQRIMTFRANAALDRMLNAPTNELDLPALLQKGRVILIDTDQKEMSPEGTHAFGKLFIALLHLAMRKRSDLPEEQLKPAFVFIDELADYVPPDRDDKYFRQLLDQSRKQRIGLTLAHQRSDQVHWLVLKALEDSAIRTQCTAPGTADLTIYGKTTRITGIPTPFPFAGRISDEEFRARYSRTILSAPKTLEVEPMRFDEP